MTFQVRQFARLGNFLLIVHYANACQSKAIFEGSLLGWAEADVLRVNIHFATFSKFDKIDALLHRSTLKQLKYN